MTLRRGAAALALALALVLLSAACGGNARATSIGKCVPRGTSACPPPYRGPDFYVSVTGRDSAAGRRSSPWRTVQHAVDYIRARHLATRSLNVFIGPGDYVLPATLAIGAADSGTSEHPVRYRARDGVNTVRLLGGRAVSGWAAWSGSISRAAVSGSFWALWENGAQARLARTPNWVLDPTLPSAKGPYLLTDSTVDNCSLTTLKYRAGALSPAGWVVADVSFYVNPGGPWIWTSDILNATALDIPTRTFTLGHQAKFQLMRGGGVSFPGSRYFAQGDLSMLDQCGEWYLDRTDAHGAPGGGLHYLYYWPCGGAIASQVVVVPSLQKVVSIAGTDSSHRVHDVTLEGVTVEYGDAPSWFRWGYPYNICTSTILGPTPTTHAYPNYDYEASTPESRFGLVYMTNTDHVSVLNVRVRNGGLNGVYTEGYNQQDVFSGNLIERVGGAGYYAEGNYPAEGDVNKSDTYTCSKVRDFGSLNANASGIALANSGSNVVSYSEIWNGQRKAIWMYTDSPGIPQQYVYAVGTLVDHVLAHDVNQDTGDTGALGVSFLDSFSGGPYVFDTFQQTIVRDVRAAADMTDIGPDCLFADNDTYGQHFSNCQASGCQHAQFRSNGSGEHVLSNVSWSGTFDPGLMDTAHIGVCPAFPY